MDSFPDPTTQGKHPHGQADPEHADVAQVVEEHALGQHDILVKVAGLVLGALVLYPHDGQLLHLPKAQRHRARDGSGNSWEHECGVVAAEMQLPQEDRSIAIPKGRFCATAVCVVISKEAGEEPSCQTRSAPSPRLLSSGLRQRHPEAWLRCSWSWRATIPAGGSTPRRRCDHLE